jgi:hypothetical protein
MLVPSDSWSRARDQALNVAEKKAGVESSASQAAPAIPTPSEGAASPKK